MNDNDLQISGTEILRHAAFRKRQNDLDEQTPSARTRFGVNYSAKGNFGEIEMDRFFIDLGCVPVSGTKRINDLHTGRGTHGVDGLYWRTATSKFVLGSERLIVVESKPGRSLPSKNVGPNQMTHEWIWNHLDRSEIDEAAKAAFLGGDYIPVLCNYDDHGAISLYRLVPVARGEDTVMQRGESWSPDIV